MQILERYGSSPLQWGLTLPSKETSGHVRMDAAYEMRLQWGLTLPSKETSTADGAVVTHRDVQRFNGASLFRARKRST